MQFLSAYFYSYEKTVFTIDFAYLQKVQISIE